MSLANVLQQSLSISFSLPQWFPTLMLCAGKIQPTNFAVAMVPKEG